MKYSESFKLNRFLSVFNSGFFKFLKPSLILIDRLESCGVNSWKENKLVLHAEAYNAYLGNSFVKNSSVLLDQLFTNLSLVAESLIADVLPFMYPIPPSLDFKGVRKSIIATFCNLFLPCL